MVDYSKWDKLVVSSDEEEEVEEVQAERGQPSVYRVGPSGSVTIPGRNVTIHGNTGQEETGGQATSSRRTQNASAQRDRKGNIADLRKKSGPTGTGRHHGGTGGDSGQQRQQQRQQGSAVKALKERKDLASQVTLDALTRNGGETEAYFWSQTHNTVRISFIVDKGTRAKDVRLRVDAGEGSLEAHVEGTQWSYAGTLFGPIAPVDEPEDLDWTLNTVHLQSTRRAGAPPATEAQQHGEAAQGNRQGKTRDGDKEGEVENEGAEKGRGTRDEAESEAPAARELRLLQVDLVKKDLGGIVMWWKSAFKGDAEIDPSALRDRSTSQEKASSTFAENFRKAQEMFVQRMRSGGDKRTPIELDIDMDESPDDGDASDEHKGDGQSQ